MSFLVITILFNGKRPQPHVTRERRGETFA
jgi:hypothetical protein